MFYKCKHSYIYIFIYYANIKNEFEINECIIIILKHTFCK